MRLGKGQLKKYTGPGGVTGAKRKTRGFGVSSTSSFIQPGYGVELYPGDDLDGFPGLSLTGQSSDGSVLLFSRDGVPFLVAGVFRDESDNLLKSAGYVLVEEPQYKMQFEGFDWLHLGRMVYYVLDSEIIAHNVRPEWLSAWPIYGIQCPRWVSLTEPFWLFYRPDYVPSHSIASIPRIGDLLFCYTALVPTTKDPFKVPYTGWFPTSCMFGGFYKNYKMLASTGVWRTGREMEVHLFAEETPMICHEGDLYVGRTSVFSKAYIFPMACDFTAVENGSGYIFQYGGILSSTPGQANINSQSFDFFRVKDKIAAMRSSGGTRKTNTDVKQVPYDGVIGDPGEERFIYEYAEISTEPEATTRMMFYETKGDLIGSNCPHGGAATYEVPRFGQGRPLNVVAPDVMGKLSFDESGLLCLEEGRESAYFSELIGGNIGFENYAAYSHGFIGTRAGNQVLLIQDSEPFHRLCVSVADHAKVIGEKSCLSVRSISDNVLQVTDFFRRDPLGNIVDSETDHSPNPEKVILNPITVEKVRAGEISTSYNKICEYFPILYRTSQDGSSGTLYYAWIKQDGTLDEEKTTNFNADIGSEFTSANRNQLLFAGKSIPIIAEWSEWWGGVKAQDITKVSEFPKLNLGVSIWYRSAAPIDGYMGPTLAYDSAGPIGVLNLCMATLGHMYSIVDVGIGDVASDIGYEIQGSGWGRYYASYRFKSGTENTFIPIYSRGEYIDKYGYKRTLEHFVFMFTAAGEVMGTSTNRRWSKNRLFIYKVDYDPEIEQHIFDEKR